MLSKLNIYSSSELNISSSSISEGGEGISGGFGLKKAERGCWVIVLITEDVEEGFWSNFCRINSLLVALARLRVIEDYSLKESSLLFIGPLKAI